jgi:hypothetical protein
MFLLGLHVVMLNVQNVSSVTDRDAMASPSRAVGDPDLNHLRRVGLVCIGALLGTRQRLVQKANNLTEFLRLPRDQHAIPR